MEITDAATTPVVAASIAPSSASVRSGETLSLPEGDAEAKAALAKFAHMDGANRLLGRGILRFDMRDPSRFVLRLPHEGQVAPAKLDDARDAVAAVQTAEKG